MQRGTGDGKSEWTQFSPFSLTQGVGLQVDMSTPYPPPTYCGLGVPHTKRTGAVARKQQVTFEVGRPITDSL